MKKNKILIISASCALGLSLVGAGVGAVLSQKSSAEVPSDTVLDDSLGDDAIGHRVKLGLDDTASDVTPEIDSVVGVRAVDGTKAGAKDVRVYFRLNTIAKVKSATITRSVATAEGEIVKESLDYNVEYAYSSVTGADQIAWVDTDNSNPVSDVTASPYYLVYTLKNIPEENWLDHVTVQAAISYGDSTPSVTAVYNVFGVLGDLAKGVNIEPITGEEGRYKAYASSEIITEAVVPEHIFGYSGFLASEIGTVVALDGPDGGAFEGCSELVSVELPDTIESFDMYCFEGCSSLTSVTLPRDLVELGNGLLNGCDSLKTIYYQAMNLSNDSNIVFTAGLEVYVAASVKSLPVRFFYNADPLVVHFGGTEAEWTALKTTDNNDNGFFIENVICSDTVTHTVTFHLGKGPIGDLTGDVDYTIIHCKLAADPGYALLLGMAFKGWYMDQAGETPWNPETPVTGDLDIYAVYEEFGPGTSASNPITLTTGEAYTKNLVPGYEKVYLTYTHPADAEADWRYLYVDESACEESEVSTVTASNLDVAIDVYKGSFEGEKEELGSNDYVSDSAVKPIGTDGDIRFLAEPGQTYCFVIDPYTNDYYPDRVYYGSLAMKFLDFEEDSIEAAGQLVYGETSTVRRDDYTRSVMTPATVKAYTPTETKAVALNIGHTNGTYADVEVYDITDPANPSSLGSDWGTSDSTMILNLEANHRYILVVDLNGATSDTNYVTLTIGEIPAGADISNPIAMTIGTPVTVNSINSEYSYYSLTLDEAADLAFTLNEGSSSYAKYFKVYDSTGEQVATATETGVQSGWGWDTTTTYGGELLERLHLEAGSYVVEVGYTSSLYSYTGFTFQVDYVQDGDYIGRPGIANLIEGTNNLRSTKDGYYYSYSPSADMDGKYLVIELPDLEGLVIDVVDADDEVIKTVSAGGQVGVKLTQGTNVIFVLRGIDNDTVSVNAQFVDTYQDGLTEDTAYTLDNAGIFASSDGGDGFIFTFSVEETGDYVFYSNTPRDLDLNRLYTIEGGNVDYEGFDNDNGQHSQTGNEDDFAAEVNLVAGTVYYARIAGYGGTDGMSADQFSIGLDKIIPGSLLSSPIDNEFLGKDATTLSGGEIATYYRDTMDQDGWYTIKIDDTSSGTLTVYSGTTVLAKLMAGDSYFLEAEANSTVTVKVEGEISFSSIYSTTVQNGSSRANAVELPSDGRLPYTYTGSTQSSYWIKFTVPTDGKYVFYSETNKDSTAYAFDPYVKYIYEGDSATALVKGSHDDPYEGHGNSYDSHVIVELKAGVTYYAEVQMPGPYNDYAVEYILEPVSSTAA